MMQFLSSRAALPVVAVAAALLGTGGTWLVSHAGGGSQVRDYLLAHPEVIPEAMQRLEDRRAGAQVAEHRAALTRPVGSAWAGNPKGDVTVVEFFDYNCGYCRASLPVLAGLVAADRGVRIVYRELPVLAPTSRDAALASLAAARQGRFAAFHDALYAGGQVTAGSIAAAARRAAVTLPATAAPADEAEVAANMRLAGRLGMTGTPAWVVGDRVLSGAMPLETLQAAVAAARAAAKS